MRQSIFISLFWAAYLPCCGLVKAQPMFIKVQTGEIATDRNNGEGASWVDFDNDNDQDLFAHSISGPDLLYLNHDGIFVRETSFGFVVAFWGGQDQSIFSDMNNDGLMDILVSKNGRLDTLYINNGFENGGSFSTLPFLDGRWWSPADFDNDGLLDVFSDDEDNVFRLYQNKGDLTFLPEQGLNFGNGSELIFGYTSNSFLLGDYNNDLLTDIFMFVIGDSVRLIKNNGNFDFTEIVDPDFLSVFGVETANMIDYDNDGDLDIFVATQDFGSVILRNDREDNFERIDLQISALLIGVI